MRRYGRKLLTHLTRKPRLSLVVAAYNVAPYIDAFFESLIAQTDGLSRLEVIVVNDGSTDHTGQIAQDWAARYPKVIRYLEQDNQGVAAARNAGLRRATGDWVSFPDPDDFFSSDYLAQMRSEIMAPENRDLLAVTAPFVFYYEDTDTYSDDHALRGRFKKGRRRYDSTDMGSVLLSHTTSTFMRRADIIAQSITFDHRVRPSFEDAHFIIRLLLRCPGRHVSFVPDPVYYYRKRRAANSLVDGIVQNPAWYGPHLEHAYCSLLTEAQRMRGHVPRFVQNNILFSLLAKLRYLTGPNYDPAVLDQAGQDLFMQNVSAVMELIETDTLWQAELPGFYLLHRLALQTLFKDQPHPLPHIALHDPTADRPEPYLRWVMGGDTPDRVRVEIDGKAVSADSRERLARSLFGRPYAQIIHQPLNLAQGQTLRVYADDQPLEVIDKGCLLGES